jgi:hypothetical protein
VTGDQALVLLTAVTTAVAVVTLILSVRKNTRTQAREDARQRAEDLGREFTRGAQSRDDEIRQLRFERDDARRDLADTKFELREARLEIERLRRGGN